MISIPKLPKKFNNPVHPQYTGTVYNLHPVAELVSGLLADNNKPVILDNDYRKLLDLYATGDYDD